MSRATLRTAEVEEELPTEAEDEELPVEEELPDWRAPVEQSTGSHHQVSEAVTLGHWTEAPRSELSV